MIAAREVDSLLAEVERQSGETVVERKLWQSKMDQIWHIDRVRIGGIEMTLVKIDSGDYINTGNVTRIYTVNCIYLIGDRGFHDEIRASFGSTSTEITPADRDRIVEAMNEPTVADKLQQIDGHLGYFVR